MTASDSSITFDKCSIAIGANDDNTGSIYMGANDSLTLPSTIIATNVGATTKTIPNVVLLCKDGNNIKAIATSTIALQSDLASYATISSLGSYYTKSETTGTFATLAALNSLSSDLSNNYYTKAKVDEAIQSAIGDAIGGSY